MRKLRVPVALILLLVVAGCASVGGGDPLVVRAEDLLTNSLSIYATALSWHDTPGNSVKETKDVYKAMEQTRVRFPSAWQALKDGVATYKRDRNQDKIQALINALQDIVNMIPSFVRAGGH